MSILGRLSSFVRGLFAPRPRRDINQFVANLNRRIRGTYDAARTGDLDNYWANADSYDADSANSKDVRHTLLSRSRYEIGNNGYSDGIAQSYANDLIGAGPALRMQTASNGFNRMVELAWYQWCRAVKFRRKLWCMAHAKHSDGETFAVMRRNPRLQFAVPLDLRLYEAEQVQTPYLPFDVPGYIDGIKFDEFGNPEWYDILREHPGTNRSMRFDLVPERVPADVVLHWFKMRRPGQHRGIPEMASTLNVGASSRRFREATLATAEKVANFTLFLKTMYPPTELDEVDPMSTFEMQKGLMTALPNTVEPFQLKAEHPATGYAEFIKTQIAEQGRPKQMSYNRAAADSSGHNFASGKLDFMPYFASLDVDRMDCDELVLDPLFDTWFTLAISRFGWLGGNPEAVGIGARAHIWDWPKHRVADVEAEANANETKLTSGQLFLHRLYSEAGMDFDDEVAAAATAFGLDEAVIRQRLFDITLPPPKQQAPSGDADDAATEMLGKLTGRLNGKVNGHANT